MCEACAGLDIYLALPVHCGHALYKEHFGLYGGRAGSVWYIYRGGCGCCLYRY